jgi:tetratricopeptide (TPR) repeat protein
VACQRGEYGKSLPDFDRAIAEQPGNSQFYRGRSLALRFVGRYREAMTDAERLLALAPQQGETHYVLGMALAGMSRYQAAINSFDESLRRRPELVYPLRARAAAYERLGDTLRASADREAAEREEREHPHYAVCLDPFRY